MIRRKGIAICKAILVSPSAKTAPYALYAIVFSVARQ